MKSKHCFFYYLQVYKPLCEFPCLDWQFYLFLVGLLAKFKFSTRTANKTCFNSKNLISHSKGGIPGGGAFECNLTGRCSFFKNLHNLFIKQFAFRYPVSELLDYKKFQKTIEKTIAYYS